MSVRRLLRSFVDRQLQAVNAGDAAALGNLLRDTSSSWRIPRLPAGPEAEADTLAGNFQAWGGRLWGARILPTQVLLDEAQRAAAVEWVLRYRPALPAESSGRSSNGDGSEVLQLLGGTTFELNDAGEIAVWHSYTDGARAHQPVPALDFSDLDPSLSPWRPRGGGTKLTSNRVVAGAAGSNLALADHRRGEVLSLLHREAELWSMTDVPPAASRPYFERVFAEDAKLINPWTVELSRESRWAGFLSFCREYTDCEVSISRVVVDAEQPNLFAVERTFTCTNRETGVRGIDEDWALGEVEDLAYIECSQDPSCPESALGNDGERLRLRYCRVYFDANSSCQERAKSTGARYGWDLPSVVNI